MGTYQKTKLPTCFHHHYIIAITPHKPIGTQASNTCADTRTHTLLAHSARLTVTVLQVDTSSAVLEPMMLQ